MMIRWIFIFHLRRNEFMTDLTQSRWLPIVLLTCANVFITFADLL